MPSPGEMMAQQAQGMPPGRGMGMPQQAGGMPGGAQGGMANQKNAVPGDLAANPIIEAMRTMMTVVAAKQEQGDPSAPEMQDLLRRFTSLLAGGGEQGPGAQPPGTPPAPQGGQMPVGRPGANPMVGNMGAGAMQGNKGQVPTI